MRETFEIGAFEVFLVLRHVGDGNYTKVGQSQGRKSYRNEDRVIQLIDHQRRRPDGRLWTVIISYDPVPS